MTTPREVLAGKLTAFLGSDVYVEPYARDGIDPGKATVMVRIDEVIRSRSAPLAARGYRYGLIVTVPSQSVAGPADDALDVLLDRVLWGIEKDTDLPQWTGCRRAVYDDKFPAYEVDITVVHDISDPTTIQE